MVAGDTDTNEEEELLDEGEIGDLVLLFFRRGLLFAAPAQVY